MQQHPLGSFFPPMDPADKQELLEDIQAHGVRVPITTYQGMVLDGWHRYCAASVLAVDCPEVAFEGDDPVGFVIAVNVLRRHLHPRQRATIILKCREWAPPGRPTPDADSLTKTNDELAAEADVSPRTIARVKRDMREIKDEPSPPGGHPATEAEEELREHEVMYETFQERIRDLEGKITQSQETEQFLRDQMTSDPAVKETVLNNQRAEITALKSTNWSLQTRLTEAQNEVSRARANIRRMEARVKELEA